MRIAKSEQFTLVYLPGTKGRRLDFEEILMANPFSDSWFYKRLVLTKPG